MSARLMGLLLLVCCSGRLAAEALQDALQAANVPTVGFSAADLAGKITSYALSDGSPFLLAYYGDDGSAELPAVLHVIRYDRASAELRRADLRDVKAVFQVGIPIDCLGSAVAIREHRGTIYIDTHYNPSAGCVVVLNSKLSLQAALSGWLIGLVGDAYAILRASEVHFMSVHPLHVQVWDVKTNHLAQVYPYDGDAQRRRFSALIEPRISMRWCAENNAQCDAENFNTDIVGGVASNEEARAFGFEVRFDASGFGESAETHARPRNVAYVFREHEGSWEHREFCASELPKLFGGRDMQQLIHEKPNLVFEQAVAKSDGRCAEGIADGAAARLR